MCGTRPSGWAVTTSTRAPATSATPASATVVEISPGPLGSLQPLHDGFVHRGVDHGFRLVEADGNDHDGDDEAGRNQHLEAERALQSPEHPRGPERPKV